MKIDKKSAVAYFLSSLVLLSGAAQARMIDAEAGGPKEHERAMRDVAADHDHHNSDRASSDKGAKAGAANNGSKAASHDKGSRSGGKKGLDLKPRDERSEAQKIFDGNKENADKVSKNMADAKDKEAMRDKTHDGRPMIGKNASVGIQTDPPGVNVRISIDSPKKEQKPPR